ncbi:MAG: hypothetical protein IT536_15530 [Hyphomicrobiales bacterium]|nr:hypothetical protein [Hyphomicrobiales bacterium]
MNERESRLRSVIVTYFPMFIATLSLVTAIYNGYLNSQFVNVIQRNVARSEYMRTCKDVIDAYFQVKFRAAVISRNRESAPSGASAMTVEQIEGANAVARLGALGTYLANLRDESVRARYTELSRAVEAAVGNARQVAPDSLEALFEPADRIFDNLNADCVKTALDQPISP